VEYIISFSGLPNWSFLNIKDVVPYTIWEIKTLLLQEMFSRGILTLGTHNMSYSHNDTDIANLLAAYDAVLPILKDAVDNKKMAEYLRCKPLEPLFKIR
jgi:glutamate-1-semialdehyde 2,1-aminomutase